MSKRELFVLSPDLFVSADPETVRATAADMRELGIYRLPYDQIDIRFRFWWRSMPSGSKRISVTENKFDQDPEVQLANGHVWTMLFLGLQSDSSIKGHVIEVDGRATTGQFTDDGTGSDIDIGGWRKPITKLLIVMLATRGAEKTVTENKLAKLGIGKKNTAYPRTTTITISRHLPDDTEHAPTGATRCAHLRRGHIRHQHYGPQRAFIKKIWIEPIFVNADPSFISQRRGYNFSMNAVDLPRAVDDVSIVNKILNPDDGVPSHESRKEPAGTGNRD